MVATVLMEVMMVMVAMVWLRQFLLSFLGEVMVLIFSLAIIPQRYPRVGKGVVGKVNTSIGSHNLPKLNPALSLSALCFLLVHYLRIKEESTSSHKMLKICCYKAQHWLPLIDPAFPH